LAPSIGFRIYTRKKQTLRPFDNPEGAATRKIKIVSKALPPAVVKADGSKGAPSAAEWAQSSVANWRFLKPGEKPQPGDIAARKENFVDATGHSAVVTAVSKSGKVTAMTAHPTKIGVDMTFQPG
jgi:hypothetical protein